MSTAIIVIGDSNTGKSSLINTLLNYSEGKNFDFNRYVNYIDLQNEYNNLDPSVSDINVVSRNRMTNKCRKYKMKNYDCFLVDTPGTTDLSTFVHSILEIHEMLLELERENIPLSGIIHMKNNSRDGDVLLKQIKSYVLPKDLPIVTLDRYLQYNSFNDFENPHYSHLRKRKDKSIHLNRFGHIFTEKMVPLFNDVGLVKMEVPNKDFFQILSNIENIYISEEKNPNKYDLFRERVSLEIPEQFFNHEILNMIKYYYSSYVVFNKKMNGIEKLTDIVYERQDAMFSIQIQSIINEASEEKKKDITISIGSIDKLIEERKDLVDKFKEMLGIYGRNIDCLRHFQEYLLRRQYKRCGDLLE